MPKVDQHGVLQEEIFSFQATKEGRVRIFWRGKAVTTLSGREAERFLARMAQADTLQAQLLMTRATGHFKHGNEKAAQRRS